METKRFTLSPISMQDLPVLTDHFSDPDTCRYSADPPLLATEIEDFILSHQTGGDVDCGRWVIRFKGNGHFVGTLGFQGWDPLNGKAEIGFDVVRDHWRQGVMSECLAVFIPYCFNELGVGVLYAFTMENNQAARGLLEKFDFQLEGVLRSWVRRMGVGLDCCAYSLLRAEQMV